MKALAALRDPYLCMLIFIALLGPVFLCMSLAMLGYVP